MRGKGELAAEKLLLALRLLVFLIDQFSSVGHHAVAGDCGSAGRFFPMGVPPLTTRKDDLASSTSGREDIVKGHRERDRCAICLESV